MAPRDKRWKTPFDILNAVGAVATILATLCAIISLIPDKLLKGTIIEKSRIEAANVVAPSGYKVSVERPEIVGKNSVFSLCDGEGALLQKKNGTESIAVSDYTYPDIGKIVLNGRGGEYSVGARLSTTEAGCYVFVKSLDRWWCNKFNFIYTCDEH